MTAVALLVLAIFAAVAQGQSPGLSQLSEVRVLPAVPELDTQVANQVELATVGPQSIDSVCDSLPTERGRVICAISQVFGERTGAGVRIASCETGGKLNANATGADGERGPMQIHPIHIPTIERMGMTWDDMYDPFHNAEFAFWLSGGGLNWTPWTTSGCAEPKE